MATSIADLDTWIQTPHENENLEFKEAKAQYDHTKLFRYSVALANEGGGKLILGITDKRPRAVCGSAAFPSPEDIARRIFEKVRFRVDVEVVNHPFGRVVVFHIPSRPRGTAYHLEGAYYMRSTEDTVPMSEDRLRHIFNEGKVEWSLEPAMLDVSSEDVVKLLDTPSYFDLLELPYPSAREAVLAKFASEELLIRSGSTWAITNLGALLFAKNLEAFEGLRRKAPRVVVYGGQGKDAIKRDLTGVKGYAVGFEGLIEFINSQTPSNEVVEQALRRQVKLFPELAIRELVANALVHQDLTETGASVMIELYADRLEISNPGVPLTAPDRFIDEYRSRNETLAGLMRRLGVCEELGSGIDKVVANAEAYQLPAPDFRVATYRTTAVLFAHKEFAEMDREERIRACYQHASLRYVLNQRMTNQTLRERFKLSEGKAETVSRIIRDAVDAGRIKPEDPTSGSKRYARYVPFWA